MPESGSLLAAPATAISSAVSDTHLASEFHLIAKDGERSVILFALLNSTFKI